MSNSPNNDRERLEELHASKLIFGLTDEEAREYNRLLAANRSVPLDALDRTVAKLDLLWCDNQSLPPELAAAIRQSANAHVPKKQTAVETVRTKPKPSVASWYPWLITACSLAVSAALVWSWPRSEAALSNLQQRERLIQSARDIIQVKWSPGPTPIEGAVGDLVWDQESQRGFMRFTGLPVNDPTKEQYQLWIFDREQSEKTPVDGGVFDIGVAGEVVVPIDARLKVNQPTLFAVTIEKPGGVVVSSRERLPLLAQVGK